MTQEILRHSCPVVGKNQKTASVRFPVQAQQTLLSQLAVTADPVMPKSLTEKLQALRAKTEIDQTADQLEEIKKMSLPQLEKETIQFGKAKLGQKFTEAYSDHKWTEWFVTQYEKSDKVAHQKFISYVEKRLDHEIETSLTSPNDVKNFKKANKPVSSEASWCPVKGEDLQSDDSAEDMSQKISTNMKMSVMEDQVGALMEENKMIHHRMGNIEGVLNELIEHVKALKPGS